MTMKSIFNLLMILLGFNCIQAQNCDFCDSPSFQADLCLNAPSWTYHNVIGGPIYDGLNIIIDEGYQIYSPVTFKNCTIRVNSDDSTPFKTINSVAAEDWQIGETRFEFIGCTIVACPGSSFGNFRLTGGSSGPFDTAANLDVEIDGCLFTEGVHLFHANGMDLKYTNNIAFGQKIMQFT